MYAELEIWKGSWKSWSPSRIFCNVYEKKIYLNAPGIDPKQKLMNRMMSTEPKNLIEVITMGISHEWLHLLVYELGYDTAKVDTPIVYLALYTSINWKCRPIQTTLKNPRKGVGNGQG